MARKSKNYEGCYILGGIPFVLICIILNYNTLICLLPILDINPYISKVVSLMGLHHKFTAVLGTGFFLTLIYCYYLYRDRGFEIVERYDELAKDYKFYRIPTAFVIIFYLVVSFLLLMLAIKIGKIA